MNIYLISRANTASWDQYVDAIVIAHNAAEASMIHPASLHRNIIIYIDEAIYETWPTSPENIIVELLGKCDPETEKNYPNRVICANFNAA